MAFEFEYDVEGESMLTITEKRAIDLAHNFTPKLYAWLEEHVVPKVATFDDAMLVCRYLFYVAYQASKTARRE
jgi:hypothetical protein